jgi:putative peptidoglycan lipid II flippase
MLRSSLIVTFLTICASVLGFVVQFVIAHRFGVGVQVDAYLFSISLPTFLAGVVSAILSFHITPRLVSVKGSVDRYNNFVRSLVIGVTAISVALIIISCGFMLALIENLPTGSPVRMYNELLPLIFLSCITGGVQALQGFLTAMLNSEKKFVLSALLLLLPYSGTLALLLVLGEPEGIKAVAIGLLAGTIASVCVGISLLKSDVFPLRWRGIAWDDLLSLTRASFSTALAITCFTSYSVVDAFWGPRAGDGALATLGYAQRLVIGVGNLAVAGPSAVLIPHLAELVRDRDYAGFMKLMRRAFIIVSSVAVIVALVLGNYSVEIVRLLFGYGRFGPEQVSVVASTVTNMMPGMVAMLISVIGFRVLFCFDSGHKDAAIVGVGWTVGYFVASSIAFKHGPSGIALAYSAIWIVTLFIIIIAIKRQISSI